MYEKSDIKVLNEHEVREFLIAAESSPHSALYHLAVKTGMRQGKLFGLKWEDLDWQDERLFVKRQVTRIPREDWRFSNPKTKSGKRVIQLGERTLDILRSQKDRVQNLRDAAGEDWQ